MYSSATSCLQAKRGPVSPSGVQAADLQLGQLAPSRLPLLSHQLRPPEDFHVSGVR